VTSQVKKGKVLHWRGLFRVYPTSTHKYSAYKRSRRSILLCAEL